MTTEAPSEASRIAMALPMPEDEPVTIATLPVKRAMEVPPELRRLDAGGSGGTARAEEVCQHGAALLGEQTGVYLDAMVEAGVVQDEQRAAAGACLGVRGGVDEATHPGMEDGGGAHRARLQGDVEIAAEKPVVAEAEAGLTESDNLGVGGGVGVADDAVLAFSQDAVVMNDDAAHGDLAGLLRLAGLVDCHPQISLIGHKPPRDGLRGFSPGANAYGMIAEIID